MYAYLNGRITDQNGSTVVLEVSNIGYLLYTPNPYVFELDREYKIYIWQQIKEDEHNLFGFKTLEEKNLFLKLISVKGLGPKLAMPILATGSINGIIDAIERENLLYLKKFPKIGEKVARQIILDLKGKMKDFNISDTYKEDTFDELSEVLKGLGYKEKEFKSIIMRIDNNLKIEDQVKEALKLLLK